jgi:DNA-binding NarL/FixJ family response regulator
MTVLALCDPPVPDTTSQLRRLDGYDRITVGIVDDEVLIRTGIRGVLEQAEGIVVVGEANDGPGAVELARAHRPHVLLIDTAMPGMAETATVRLVRRHVPATQVVMLATPTDSELLLPVLRAGAAGFLRKDGEPGDLVKAVRVVAAGEAILCPATTRSLVDHVAGGLGERRDQASIRVGGLTQREREVLIHVAKGMGNARIARILCLSEGSIKAYVSRLFTKLRCDNRVQAALMAYDAGLV